MKDLFAFFLKDTQIIKLIFTFSLAIVLYISLRLIKVVGRHTIKDVQVRYRFRKALVYFSFFFYFIVIFLIWFEKISQASIMFSIIGAGLALSLQEMVLCFAGWMLIILKQPFRTGDRIETDNLKGDVIDITTMHTVILEVGNWVDAEQSTGRIVHIPNSRIFRSNIYNFTQGFPFVWNELGITIRFDSDWKKAKEIIKTIVFEDYYELEGEIKKILEQVDEKFPVKFSKLTPFVFTQIQNCGVKLTLRYLTPVRSRRNREHIIHEKILVAFGKETSVEFAYPTQTVVVER